MAAMLGHYLVNRYCCFLIVLSYLIITGNAELTHDQTKTFTDSCASLGSADKPLNPKAAFLSGNNMDTFSVVGSDLHRIQMGLQFGRHRWPSLVKPPDKNVPDKLSGTGAAGIISDGFAGGWTKDLATTILLSGGKVTNAAGSGPYDWGSKQDLMPVILKSGAAGKRWLDDNGLKLTGIFVPKSGGSETRYAHLMARKSDGGSVTLYYAIFSTTDDNNYSMVSSASSGTVSEADSKRLPIGIAPNPYLDTHGQRVVWIGEGWYHTVLTGSGSYLPGMEGHIHPVSELTGCIPNLCINGQIDAAGYLNLDGSSKPWVSRGPFLFPLKSKTTNPMAEYKTVADLMSKASADKKFNFVMGLTQVKAQGGSLVFGKTDNSGAVRNSGLFIDGSNSVKGTFLVNDNPLGTDLVIEDVYYDNDKGLLYIFYGKSYGIVKVTFSGSQVTFALNDNDSGSVLVASTNPYLPSDGINAILERDNEIVIFYENWIYKFSSWGAVLDKSSPTSVDLLQDSEFFSCADSHYSTLPMNYYKSADLAGFKAYNEKNKPEDGYGRDVAARQAKLWFYIAAVLAVLSVVAFVVWFIFFRQKPYTESEMDRILDYLEKEGLVGIDGKIPTLAQLKANPRLPPINDIAKGKVNYESHKSGRKMSSRSRSKSKGGGAPKHTHSTIEKAKAQLKK